jgi:hypothetical protein
MNKSAAPGIVIVLILALGVFVQSQLLINWDVSWWLLATKKWLAGGTYTTDFFDPSPPMILYLNSVPVLLAKIFALNAVVIFRIYTFIISSAVLILSNQFLKLIFPENPNLKNIWIVSLSVAFWLVPSYEFGQRDYFVMMFLTPYLLSVLARMQNNPPVTRSVAILTGVLAAISFGIKPYYLIILCMSELYLLFQSRRLANVMRLELISMGITFAIYLTSIIFLFPDYFSVIVPYALRLYPGGMAIPIKRMLSFPPMIFCMMTLVIAQIFPVSTRNKNIIRYISFILLGFLGIFIYQRELFYYHIIPALAYSVILLSFIITLTSTEKNKAYFLPVTACVVPTLFFIMHYNPKIWTILIFEPEMFYLYFIVIFSSLLFFTGKNGFTKNSLNIFFIISLSCLFSTWLLVTGNFEHRFTWTIVCMLVLYAIFTPAKNLKIKLANALTASLAIFIFAYPAYFIYVISENSYQDDTQCRDEFTKTLSKLSHDGPVTILSTQIANIFPSVVYAKADYSSRFPFLWMLPSLIHNQSPQASLDREFMIDKIAVDLDTKKPKYVFIDSRENKAYLHLPFNYITTFSQNKNFLNAWQHYIYLKSFTLPGGDLTGGVYMKFDIYKRM